MSTKLIFLFLTTSCISERFKLEGVLIISRHNLRTPLSDLAFITPRQWPELTAKMSHLSSKGKLLEGLMGGYFYEWLNGTELFDDDCDKQNEIFVYSNILQRTKETAKAFLTAAFPDCNVPIHHKDSINTTTDPDTRFKLVVTNTTYSYKMFIIDEIYDALNRTNLTDVYAFLNNVLDIKNSVACKKIFYCDLRENRNEVILEKGREVRVAGPFSIAQSVSEAFLLSLYEGTPLRDIAWGHMKTEKDWNLVRKMLKANLMIKFGIKSVVKDVIRPMLTYLNEVVDAHKFTLIMGHDSTIVAVMTVLDFEPYHLPEQLEIAPIGGKLVFQKWSNGKQELLKVEYVYQSVKQLRNAEELSLQNPPKIVTLKLQKCADYHGFCRWIEFLRLLKEAAE